MASNVSPYGRLSATSEYNNNVQQPRDTQEVFRTLLSVNADLINCVSQRLTSNILKNIGPIGCAKVHAKVSEIKFPHSSLTESSIAHAASVEQDPTKRNFLSEEKIRIVEKALQDYFVSELTYRLSNPEYFYEAGLDLEISDYFPTDFIKEIFAKVDITLGMDDVPRKYTSGVIWDRSNKSPEVFAVIFREISEGVVFDKSSIALKV